MFVFKLIAIPNTIAITHILVRISQCVLSWFDLRQMHRAYDAKDKAVDFQRPTLHPQRFALEQIIN